MPRVAPTIAQETISVGRAGRAIITLKKGNRWEWNWDVKADTKSNKRIFVSDEDRISGVNFVRLEDKSQSIYMRSRSDGDFHGPPGVIPSECMQDDAMYFQSEMLVDTKQEMMILITSLAGWISSAYFHLCYNSLQYISLWSGRTMRNVTFLLSYGLWIRKEKPTSRLKLMLTIVRCCSRSGLADEAL